MKSKQPITSSINALEGCWLFKLPSSYAIAIGFASGNPTCTKVSVGKPIIANKNVLQNCRTFLLSIADCNGLIKL